MRLNDEKDLRAGDVVPLLRKDGSEFARVEITCAREVEFAKLSEADWEGHELSGSRELIAEEFRRFYGSAPSPTTLVKAVRFRILPRGVIARGAEAVIEREGEKTLIKTRVAKGYRHAAIDSKLRLQRTRLEARVLKRAKAAGVNVPRIHSSDERGAVVRMEFLDGPTLKAAFDVGLSERIADQVIRLHSAGIIHGDLTTSNMVLSGGKVHLIDFGLARFSASAEDRAVDLHVLEEALASTHTGEAAEAFARILSAYETKFPEVAARLKKVESRGRYVRRKED